MRTAIRLLIAAGLGLLGASAAWADELVVTGAVTDAFRRPVADARVTARLGEVVVETRSSASGAYVCRLPDPGRGSDTHVRLFAVKQEGDAVPRARRVEVRASVVASRRIDLALKPLLRRQLLVALGPSAIPCPDVEVTLFAGGRFGDLYPWRTLRSDERGILDVVVPEGTYTAVVADPRWARGVVAFRASAQDLAPSTPLRIPMARGRELRFRLHDATSGEPVPGVSIQATRDFARLFAGAEPFVTDARGEVTVDRVPVQLRSVIASRRLPPRRVPIDISGGKTEVSVALPSRGEHVLIRDLDPRGYVPPEGSPVVLRRRHVGELEERYGTIQGGRLVVPNHVEEGGDWIAIIDERHAARLAPLRHPTPSEVRLLEPRRAEAVIFHTAERLSLRVLSAAGDPIAKQPIHGEGRMSLRAADGRLVPSSLSMRTDDEGRAHADGVFWTTPWTGLASGPAVSNRYGLGSHAPRPEEHVVRLPPLRRVDLHVTTDGIKGVPSDLRIHAGGSVTVYEVEPEAAIVQLTLAIPSDATDSSVSLDGPGLARSVVPLADRVPGVERLEVALSSERTLCLFHDDHRAAGEQVQLHRWLPEEQRWRYRGSLKLSRHAIGLRLTMREVLGREPWRVVDGLPTGRYRVVHAPTGRWSGPIDIDLSKPVWEARVDFGDARTVAGRVEGPAGMPWHAGWIECEAGAPALEWSAPSEAHSPEHRDRGALELDGTFELEIPDVPGARLTFRHPLCHPLTVQVPEGGEPLVVTLRPRTLLRIPLDLASEPPWPTDLSALVRHHTGLRMPRLRRAANLRSSGPPVLRRTVGVRGAVTWEPIDRLYRDKVVWLAVEPGTTMTLAIDPLQHVPAVLPEITVPKEGRVLPRVSFERGAELRVRVVHDRLPRGNANLHRALVKAQLPNGLTVEREALSGYRAGPLVVRGLPAAPVELTVAEVTRGVRGSSAARTRRLDVDMRTQVAVEVDLRGE